MVFIQRWRHFLFFECDKAPPFHKEANLTSEPIEMLAKVTGPQASLKMTFYGQYERQLLSLVTGQNAVGKARGAQAAQEA